MQTIFMRMRLEGDLKTRGLTAHEIDTVTAALTGHLYLQRNTELTGDEEEGNIVIPGESDWRRLQL